MRIAFRRKLINTTLFDHMPYRLFRFFVDMTSINFHMGRRETHVLPEHIRYQTALDYTRAASGIYNIPRSLPNLTPDLSRIQQPTLLLWGNRDQSLDPESFSKVEEELPNVVASHSFPICGHVPHQCHPDEFNPHVMKFLNDLRPERSDERKRGMQSKDSSNIKSKFHITHALRLCSDEVHVLSPLGEDFVNVIFYFSKKLGRPDRHY